MMKKRFLAASVAFALGLPAVGMAESPSEEEASAFDFDFYGSIRMQGEYVDPDDSSVEDDYFGFRDAYSRLGAKASYDAGPVTFFGHVESGLDLANFRIQGPYEQNDTSAHDEGQLWDHLRIAKVGISGDFGTVAFGQDWLPYYNAIAYPVDMFSTYYSGFATYTAFRRNNTLAYYSPDWSGFSFSGGYSHEGGDFEEDGDADDRYQLTASYTVGGTTLSAGLDDLGGADDMRIYGLSLMHTIENVGDGSVYIGAKAERFASDRDDGYGEDGDTAVNLFASYSVGKHTVKGMVADVPEYGDNVFHAGYDYQLMEDLKLFAEYYYEEEPAAITTRRGGATDTLDAGGGQTVSLGFRYDF
ncbi:MAG: porin [Guyparkeria sp.]|uniref:porin n=1 Tax=Guyparkeria sp. TaxID=2035736 RepID=UPI003979826A